MNRLQIKMWLVKALSNANTKLPAGKLDQMVDRAVKDPEAQKLMQLDPDDPAVVREVARSMREAMGRKPVRAPKPEPTVEQAMTDLMDIVVDLAESAGNPEGAQVMRKACELHRRNDGSVTKFLLFGELPEGETR